MNVKFENGIWKADIRPNGSNGKRFRKQFETKKEALAWLAYIKHNHIQNKEWQSPNKIADKRRMSELVVTWFKHHGKHLASGEDTAARLHKMCIAIGNPIAEKFSAQHFVEYRTNRIDDGISAANMNRELSYVKAMFNELISLKMWNKENPVQAVRTIKTQDIEMSFLTMEQIRSLLHELQQSDNPHVTLISKICLATGARWSEAELLKITQIKNRQIQFVNTKSKRLRNVPIAHELENEIRAHFEDFRSNRQDNSIFESSYSAFRNALERSKIDLPDGQCSHVLRHTFASHFTINGGNIVALQKLLGHSSLNVTMKYAHLSPDHLNEAIRLNPLSLLK